MRSMILGAGLALTLVFSGFTPVTTPKAHGVASCAACYASGYTKGYGTACTTCESAGSSAMQIIDKALIASEQAILASTGMSNPSGTNGFPLLYRTIKSSNQMQTGNLRDALDTTTKMLAKEIRRIPSTRQKIDSEQLNGKAAPDYDTTTDQAIKRGAGYSQPTPSSMGQIQDWRSGEAVLASLEDADRDSDQPSQQNKKATNTSNVADPERKQVRQVHDLMKTLRKNDDTTFSELNANLLVSDRNRILGNSPTDSDDYSQQDKAQLYLQLLAGTDVSNVDALLEGDGFRSASQTDQIVNQAVDDMKLNTALAVQDRYVRMRQLHPKSLGMGTYMREAMPNAAVVMGDSERFDVPSDKQGDMMSDEAFMSLTSTYRSRSPQWLAKVAADSNYAVRSAARIEAERLYIKFQRWQTKREINMMLAQLLASRLKQSNNDN